jgi:hypothetical protein
LATGLPGRQAAPIGAGAWALWQPASREVLINRPLAIKLLERVCKQELKIKLIIVFIKEITIFKRLVIIESRCLKFD